MPCYHAAMPKIPTLKPLCLLALFVFCFALAPAQVPAKPPLPKDPLALLELAAQANGLTNPKTHPWHLVATMIRYGDKDEETKRGTYEEFWEAPEHYKIIYTADKFQQTALRTPEGLFVSGTEGFPPEHLLLDMSLPMAPLTGAILPDARQTKLRSQKFGAAHLDCLTQNLGHSNYGDILGPTYCLEQDTTTLRAITNFSGASQILFNQLITFDGQTIARDIVQLWNGKKQLAIQVTQFEMLASKALVEQTAPSGFVLSTALPEFTSRAGVDQVLSKVPPSYPTEAKQQHAQGTIELKAAIDNTGHVTGLQVISGPVALQHAATDAVRQWRYKPFIVYGQPSACTIKTNVIFTLGG